MPVIQQWVNDGNVPDDVELMSVAPPHRPAPSQLATPGLAGGGGLDRPRDHGRPGLGSVAVNYGMIRHSDVRVLDGNNTNLGRWSGRSATEGLDQLVQLAQSREDGDQASKDLIFSRRLTCRSSRENRASKNVVTSSSASASPMTRDPRLSTLTSSCSTI